VLAGEDLALAWPLVTTVLATVFTVAGAAAAFTRREL
jgi:hypothetical protein